MVLSLPIPLTVYVLALELMLLLPAALLAALAFRDRQAPHRRNGHAARQSGTSGEHGDALDGCAS